MDDLLSSEFSFHDQCVMGPLRSLSEALTLLQKNSVVDAGQVSCLYQQGIPDKTAGFCPGLIHKLNHQCLQKSLTIRYSRNKTLGVVPLSS